MRGGGIPVKVLNLLQVLLNRQHFSCWSELHVTFYNKLAKMSEKKLSQFLGIPIVHTKI